MPINAPMQRRKARLGYLPDLPDIRDYHFAPEPDRLQSLPAAIDLMPDFPVYDQGEMGSCTANALAGAIQFDRRRAGEIPDFVPSRLFIYYNERTIEGSVKYDSGAMLRDGIKSLHKQGVCPESEWPYVVTPADGESNEFPPGAAAATRPPPLCYQDALPHAITHYQRVQQDLAHLQCCLASGFPFVFGFTVFDSWVDNPSPPTLIPLPTHQDNAVGGHAVLCVGYSNRRKQFHIRNSWGKDVGEEGYFWMPYDYLLDKRLANDFWVINAVQG
ncbi:C1 family peptidase [Musicola keenii]|uniref:C1 family peptidase n=1 Tax=Musicola keenii TaxID=2884250 RepID=UPI00177B6A56|nr:C1 family peptidase [Musicola keenii]